MKTYNITGTTGTSQILVGEKLQNLPRYIPSEKAVIVTDANVDRLYKDAFPPYPKVVIDPGEGSKTLAVVEKIYGRLLEMEADRTSFVVGIGGGVVCDIAGFAASTYMRGLSFGFVATSLLAQVDASVGGKNGVNFRTYKNLVGTFNQPEFVICDLGLLNTLPEKEALCGLAEVVKHALIRDAALFDYLESHVEAVRALERGAAEKMVAESVVIKSEVVNRDEREGGLRRILNFGHTFGHAVEHLTGISHGEAVSIGMVMACDISVRKGLLDPAAAARAKTLLQRLGLPVSTDIDLNRFMDAVGKDKKRERDFVHFVLLKNVGETVVEKIILDDLMQA